MLSRLASVSFRRRRLVITLWLLALVGIQVAAASLGGDWATTARLPGTDSQAAYDLRASAFPASDRGDPSAIVLHRAGGLDLSDPNITTFLDAVRSAPGVLGVDGGQRAPDGETALVPIRIDHDHGNGVASALPDLATPLRSDGTQVEFGGDWFRTGGVPATEGFGLLAAAIILLIAFGSVVAMGLPLVTAIVGIGIGLGAVSLWAAITPTPDFTVQVASMIGIGVGIDYALFIVTRYREALHRGLSPHDATVEAITTAGRAVVFAGTTVMVSLLGMLLVRLEFLNGLAWGSSTAVAIAVAASVTLTPALLGVAGRRIDRFAVHRRHGIGRTTTVWHRWSELLQRRAGRAALLGLGALVALGAPVFALRLGSADSGNDPKGTTTRSAYDLLSNGFGPGFNGPLLVVASTPTPDSHGTLARLTAALREQPGVAFVSDPQPSPSGDAAIVTVMPTTGPQSTETADLLHRIRTEVVPPFTGPSGLVANVGGPTASDVDFASYVGARMPAFIGAVLVLSFVVLLLVFRSVLVPLKAVVMNLLSIGAAYGVMVAVFQWGWGGSLLGIGSGAPIEPWAPMMLFAIVFGLSMDYEVFLLSKVREHYTRTGDNSAAVVEGLASTARVISAAAAIMVCVFGFFVFGDMRSIKLIGLGLAVAVFVDATVVRLVLVPATMELLGDRNWWLPRWMDRLLPHLDVEATPVRRPLGPAIDLTEADHAPRLTPRP